MQRVSACIRLPLEQVKGSQYMIGQETQEEDDQGNDDGGQCLPVRKPQPWFWDLHLQQSSNDQHVADAECAEGQQKAHHQGNVVHGLQFSGFITIQLQAQCDIALQLRAIFQKHYWGRHDKDPYDATKNPGILDAGGMKEPEGVNSCQETHNTQHSQEINTAVHVDIHRVRHNPASQVPEYPVGPPEVIVHPEGQCGCEQEVWSSQVEHEDVHRCGLPIRLQENIYGKAISQGSPDKYYQVHDGVKFSLKVFSCAVPVAMVIAEGAVGFHFWCGDGWR